MSAAQQLSGGGFRTDLIHQQQGRLAKGGPERGICIACAGISPALSIARRDIPFASPDCGTPDQQFPLWAVLVRIESSTKKSLGRGHSMRPALEVLSVHYVVPSLLLRLFLLPLNFRFLVDWQETLFCPEPRRALPVWSGPTSGRRRTRENVPTMPEHVRWCFVLLVIR